MPPSGAVLNNATAPATPQLGGRLPANPNLRVSWAARLIINQVLLNGSQSNLQGKLEVAGTPVPVILANPSGIACDGCGFIGVPHSL